MDQPPSQSPTPQYFQRSPIDSRDTLFHPFDFGQVEFTYPLSKVTGEVKGGGHHAKVNGLDEVRMPLFGMKLKLKQLHFHSPSEHLVSGVSWPLELHMVHDIEGGQSGTTVKSTMLVIGVFFLDPQTIEFNPNHCLPPVSQRSRFYRYEGSLTSGDLSETASWQVFEQPVMVIDKDIRKMLETSEQTPREPEEVSRRVIPRSFP